MDATKEVDRTKATISKRELQIEKFKKKVKDSDLALETMRKDNIMMRQDLSVF